MSPEEHSEFWRKVQFTVDKDVVRTDRSNHFFRGENNPNVEIMRCLHTPDLNLSLFLSVISSIHPHHSHSGAPARRHRHTYSFHIQSPAGKLQMSFMRY